MFVVAVGRVSAVSTTWLPGSASDVSTSSSTERCQQPQLRHEWWERWRWRCWVAAVKPPSSSLSQTTAEQVNILVSLCHLFSIYSTFYFRRRINLSLLFFLLATSVHSGSLILRDRDQKFKSASVPCHVLSEGFFRDLQL